jgi:ketosteroid isomerase-like protein
MFRVGGKFIIVVAISAVLVGPAAAQRKPHNGFVAFLDRMDAAQRELQNGRGATYKELWSHAEDVTLSGGFGGAIEKGWTNVSARLDWVAKQFSNGTNQIQRLVSAASGDLGYVVQSEHIMFRIPGKDAPSTKSYRVTVVFRRKHGSWKIVHRQADSNLVNELQH